MSRRAGIGLAAKVRLFHAAESRTVAQEVTIVADPAARHVIGRWFGRAGELCIRELFFS